MQLPFYVLTEIYLNLDVDWLKSLNISNDTILQLLLDMQYKYNKFDWIRFFKIMERVLIVNRKDLNILVVNGGQCKTL